MIPGLGRSPGGGHGHPLQYSCLENPMDRGAWCTTVHGDAKNRTRLSDFISLHFTFCHKGGVICVSEVIDISPGNLDSSLCFFQPSISHDVLLLQLRQRFSRVRLCDPIDGSPPGSPVPGILQARTLAWVAVSFSNA